MKIFDFLMNNIGFVIVIGGFLLTMLSRQRAKSGDPRSNPKMPSFGGSPDGSEPGQWIPGRKTKETASEVREVPRTVVPEAYRSEESQTSTDSRWGKSARERQMSTGTDARDYGRLTETSGSSTSQSTGSMGEPIRDTELAASEAAYAESVRRGVIWAEILGPPRAKQPYSRK